MTCLTTKCILAVVVVIGIWMLMRSRESYIMENPLRINQYPYNPLNTQSVYSQPSNQFQLQTTPAGTDRGAYKSLQIVADRVEEAQKHPVNYQVNSGYKGDGNLWVDMSLSNQVSGVQGMAWNTL
jgi:hypothetical protein